MPEVHRVSVRLPLVPERPGAPIDLLFILLAPRVQSDSAIEEDNVLFDGIAPDAQLVGRELRVGIPRD